MKLYWHRWRCRDATCFLLFDFPQTYANTTRSLGEIAFVHRLSDYWRGNVNQYNDVASHWLHSGSPLRTRRLVEAHIDRKSIALFDEDTIEFVQPKL